MARVIFLISKLGVEFDNSKSRLFTSEFYRASEKTCKFLKIGGIIQLVARPTDRQPISRSWKDSGSIIATHDKTFNVALYIW